MVTLVEKAKAGNSISMEQLVDLFHQDIFRMVYYRTRSKMDAEDLTQEIFIKMFKSLRRLNDARKFRAWLYRIAVNCVRDFHRKKNMLTFFGTISNLEESIPNDQNPNNPIFTLMRKEFLNRLHEFTKALPRWEREVFLLRFVDDLGIREIADVLNKNDSTIKTHLYRALKKMRQNLTLRKLLTGEES
ncbi:MAG: RNA polymerase sigma factor [Deltaproteobacteria bacterium]|nr:RNA polymerase sigma factor [Deltaproteobacteria bacterium]